MKVLHIYRTYYPDPPGGLQQAIRQIASGCQTLGVTSRIYTLSPNPAPQEVVRPEGTVYRSRSHWAPASCDLGGTGAFRLFSECAEWADILHFHYPWPFADLLNLLPSVKRKPKAMTYHSDIVKQKVLGKLYAPLMRHTLSDMDAVVATSPTYARTSPVLSRHVPPERLHVIPLCMGDSTKEAESMAPTDVIARLGLANQTFVLSLGVLRAYKGLHVLVDAAQRVKGTIVIAGSGPEEANLRHQVNRLGVNNVVFAGQVSEAEKHALLRHCAALALPSHLRSEAYGMVLLEAAMHAKPMISCEIGTGTSFVNQDGETGIVIPPEDAPALARAVNTLLSNPAESQAMGQKALERYQQHFTPDVMASLYFGLYQRLIKG